MREGATGVPDGSEAHPYSDIGAAILAAGDDGWVLVTDGRYLGSVRLARSTHILGRCAARVLLDGDATGVASTVDASVPGGLVDLRGLSIGGPHVGVTVRGGAYARLASFYIRRAGGAGIIVSGPGSRLEVSDTVIRETGLWDDGTSGHGVQVLSGGTFVGAGVVIASNLVIGLFAAGAGSSVALRESVIRDTSGSPSTPGGYGLYAGGGTVALLERALVEGNTTCGVRVFGRLTMNDTVERGTRSERSGGDGSGACIEGGGELSGTRVLIEHDATTAILAVGLNSRVELSRSVLRDDLGAYASEMASIDLSDASIGPERIGLALPPSGGGVFARRGARVTLTRSRVAGSAVVGVFAQDPGTSVVISDSIVEDTASTSVQNGNGVSSTLSARVEISNSRIARNRGNGVSASSDARISISDSLVSDTRATDDGFRGYGLYTVENGTITAHRVLVTENRECGAYSGDPSTIVISDSIVRRTLPRASTGLVGVGIAAERGGRIEATRVLVSENREVGVLSRDPGSFVSFEDGAVIDMVPNADPRGIDGGAVQAYYGGTLQIRRSLVARNPMVALMVFGDHASMLVTDTEVRDTTTTVRGSFGFGLSSVVGGTLTARRVLVVGSREGGGGSQGSRLSMEDVIVESTTPTRRGFGIGLAAAAAGVLEGDRIAIVNVFGAALGAVRTGFVGPSQPSRVTVRDVFIRGVRPSTITVGSSALERGSGAPVAYALFAALACRLDVTRAVVDSSQFGLFSSDGVVGWADGVITGQTRSAITASSAEGVEMIGLRDVRRDDNALDTIEVDPSLPELRLPPPGRPCADPPVCSM